MFDELLKKLEDLYPNEMVMHDADAFTRGKKVGRIELIQEIKLMIEEGTNGR